MGSVRGYTAPIGFGSGVYSPASQVRLFALLIAF